MSFGKSKAPPPPDYAASAKAQGAANEAAARVSGKLNNPNIISPYGNQNVTFNGDQPTITQTLSPAQQGLFDQENRLSQSYGNLGEAGLSRVADAYSKPFDTSSLPQIGDGITERDQVTQAIMDRMRPEMDRQRQSREGALIQQGHSRSGQAYGAQEEALNQRENDAMLGAIMAGGQEQSRLFSMQSANRNQALQEQSFLRNQPLSEVNALRTGSQPTMPQFQGYQGSGNVRAPDIFGATQQQYGDAVGNVNARNAQAGNTAGTFGSVVGGMMAMSDKRLKRDIEKIGVIDGLNVYSYKYIWDNVRRLGFMAQEVMAVKPEAVKVHKSGYYMVNYNAVL